MIFSVNTEEFSRHTLHFCYTYNRDASNKFLVAWWMSGEFSRVEGGVATRPGASADVRLRWSCRLIPVRKARWGFSAGHTSGLRGMTRLVYEHGA
jgi:hypothetical protein